MKYEKICRDCQAAFVTTIRKKQLCPKCFNIHSHQGRHKYKFQGKCPICGNECFTGAKRCYSCRTQAGITSRICPSCGGKKSPPGENCRSCSIILRRKPRKTGRYRDKKGYIMVYAPEHPRIKAINSKGGKRRQNLGEHIIVWEEAHKKRLPQNWVIHHLNGIRDDNRIKNLFAQPKKDHRGWTYVKALQTRIRELEQLHLPI